MLSRTLEAACRGSLLFYSNKPSRKEKLDITSLVFSEIFVELSVSCMLLAFLRPCMEADVDDDVASCHRPTTTEKRLSLRSLQSILVGQTLNTWSTILKKIGKKVFKKGKKYHIFDVMDTVVLNLLKLERNIKMEKSSSRNRPFFLF